MIFTIADPKNMNEAVAQANRYTRALQMEAEGYSVEVNDELQSGLCYLVRKTDDTVYTVDPLTQKCNCSDFVKTGRACKHMMFINVWEAKQEVLRDEAQAAQYQLMYGVCELETTGCDPYARY